MLREPELSDTAVLVNELGDVGLDHFLVEKMDENTVLLESGCLCCTIREDLKGAIIELNSKRERAQIPYYKRMIIETTGLADPSPIIFTLNSDIIIKHHYRLGSIITTVDAVNGHSQLKRHPESVKQATVADRIVVSKTDIANEKDVRQLKTKLKLLNPTSTMVEAVDGVVDVTNLLSDDIYDVKTKSDDVARWLEALKFEESDHNHSGDKNRHDKNIYTFTLVFDKALDWTAFGIWLTMILHAHGEKMLRVKGILNVKGVNVPVVINGVQHVVHPPIHLKEWPDGDKRSRIVFIVDGLEQALIERSLAAFNKVGKEIV